MSPCISLIPITLAMILTIEAHSMYLNKTCGELTCKMYQWCSVQEMLCMPCEQICNTGSHNYDQVKCENFCSDYVHDVQIGYARRSDVLSLSDDVDKIYTLVVVILILVFVLILMIGGVLAKWLYQYKRRLNLRKLEQKKFEQKLSAVQYTISNNNSKRDDLPIDTISQSTRINMPSTMTLTTQTDSPPSTNKSTSTTKTLPLSVEEPCEDTTLDYAAYVNQALSHSPPNEVHLCPTKLDM